MVSSLITFYFNELNVTLFARPINSYNLLPMTYTIRPISYHTCN